MKLLSSRSFSWIFWNLSVLQMNEIASPYLSALFTILSTLSISRSHCSVKSCLRRPEKEEWIALLHSRAITECSCLSALLFFCSVSSSVHFTLKPLQLSPEIQMHLTICLRIRTGIHRNETLRVSICCGLCTRRKVAHCSSIQSATDLNASTQITFLFHPLYLLFVRVKLKKEK